MKKLTFILSLFFVSNSFASFTRMAAVGNSPHISDESQIIDKADVGLNYGEFAAFHWGSATTGTTVPTYNAQGGFLRKTENSAWGFYLGNNYANLNQTRTESTTAASLDVLTVENPINFYWGTKAGDFAYGLGFLYSSSANLTTKSSQAVMGASFGFTYGAWDGALLLVPTNTAKNDNSAGNEVALAGKSPMNLFIRYTADTLYVYVNQITNGYKTTKASAVLKDTSSSNMILGFVQSHPFDGGANQWFYGLSYNSLVEKDNGTSVVNTTTIRAPMIIGAEANATDWLTLRGSITENFLIGSTKPVSSDDTGVRGNNTVAAGCSLKFNKWTIDGTFSDVTNANLGLDSKFITDVSMTYMF